MPRLASLFRKAVAVFLVLAVLPAATVWAASPPQPTYGTANVDGSDSEWVSSDLFAITYWTQDSSRQKAEVYLRYDCDLSVLYVRVKGYQSTYRIDADDNSSEGNDEHEVWIDNVKQVDAESTTDDGTPPDFAYYDFNGSNNTAGGWEASVSLAPGDHTLLVQTVSYVISGGTENLVSRTKTSGGSLGYIPLEIDCSEYDYGDLPSSYNMVTNSDNGGRHAIGSLYLGVTVDAEPDGQENASALGDDNNNDDEDGIWPLAGFIWRFGTAASGNGGKLNVFVTGGPGCLWGWVNWNNLGAFGGTGETIFNGVLVQSGQQTLSFDIPGGTAGQQITGNYFARFRLYPTNAQGTCSGVSGDEFGTASNGEVEDYVFDPGTPTAVTITNLSARAGASALPFALAAGGLVLLVGLAVAFRRER